MRLYFLELRFRVCRRIRRARNVRTGSTFRTTESLAAVGARRVLFRLSAAATRVPAPRARFAILSVGSISNSTIYHRHNSQHPPSCTSPVDHIPGNLQKLLHYDGMTGYDPIILYTSCMTVIILCQSAQEDLGFILGVRVQDMRVSVRAADFEAKIP